MALVVRQPVISPITHAYAQSLLIGDSLKCGKVWCRYHWINAILFTIKDMYRDWSFNQRCDAVIRSLEQKHFGHREKALTDLIDFVTTKVGDPGEIRQKDLRMPLLMITCDKISEEVKKRCPASLQEFHDRYYERILLQPQLLSSTASRRSEVIGEIELAATRSQAMFEGRRDGNIYRKTIGALGLQFKSEELSKPVDSGDLAAFREEIEERIIGKVQMLLLSEGEEPIDEEKLRLVLGTDIECLDPTYIAFFVDTLRVIQEYPNKRKLESNAKLAFQKANEACKNAAADLDMYNQLNAVKMPLKRFGELMEFLVVDPMTQIIFNGEEVEGKYLQFIDDPQGLAEEVHSLSSKEEIKQAIKRRLCDPKLKKINPRQLKDVQSHVCACIEKQFASESALMSALFANAALAKMIDRPVDFTKEIFALRLVEKKDIPSLVEVYVGDYTKPPFSVFQFFALEIDVKSLQEDIDSLKKKKIEFIDSRFDDEWQLINFELRDACKDIAIPEDLIGAQKLRSKLIEKNATLMNELGRLEMAVQTGSMEGTEAASQMSEIQAELDDLFALGGALKKWMDMQARFEQARDQYFLGIDSMIASKEEAIRLSNQDFMFMFDELYDWAGILRVRPDHIGSFLGQNWEREVIDEYMMSLREYQASQKKLSIAEQMLYEAKVDVNTKLIPGKGFTLANYLQDPEEYLRFVVCSFINASTSFLQSRLASRRNKQAKKITPIVMQNVVDKAAEEIAVEKSWRNVTCSELFKLGRKISGRKTLDKNEKALLSQMIGHIHKPIFDLSGEEIVLIEESHTTTDSYKWNDRTIDACSKFLAKYHEKMLSLTQT